MKDQFYSKACRTVQVVQEAFEGRDFCVFGSFARRKFHVDSGRLFNESSDLDVMANYSDAINAIRNLRNCGINVERKEVLDVPETLFGAMVPAYHHVKYHSVRNYIANGEKITPIHLLAVPKRIVRLSELLINSQKPARKVMGVNYLLASGVKLSESELQENLEYIWGHYK